MKTEEQIKKELNEMLSKEISNRSTVILIEAKIADLCQAYYSKAFKRAKEIALDVLKQ